MVDHRFFPVRDGYSLEKLLRKVGGVELEDKLSADALATQIVGAGTVPFLAKGEIGFVADPEYLPQLASLADGVVLIKAEIGAPTCGEGVTLIFCDDPYFTFTQILQVLYGLGARAVGFCRLDMPHIVGKDPQVAPNVLFGEEVEIGDNVMIGAGTSIGRGVTIGHNVTIGDNVTINCAHVGDDVVIHAGARIGIEGFGFLPRANGPQKIPQLGRVVLQNGVEIGANSCIDRGTLDDTIVGENSKIDNLVQIGHNTKIGRNCQIAAKCGFAGSSEIGDNVLFGGRSSIVNKAKLGDRCVVMACSTVTKSQEAGKVLAGNPAIDIKQWRRMQARLKRMGRA